MVDSNKIILDVPYYSQYLDVKDENWKSRSCGIVCLKMVLDSYKSKNDTKISSVDGLIKEMEFINGFGSFGSDHESLVILARNYGFHAYRQEFRSMVNDLESKIVRKSKYEDRLAKDGIDKIIHKIENNQPVIVSVIKDFSRQNKFHLVVLTGFQKSGNELKGFYYHDPDSLNIEDGKHKFVPINTFKKHWRKMAIYVKI